jgi:hypothetical protein
MYVLMVLGAIALIRGGAVVLDPLCGCGGLLMCLLLVHHANVFSAVGLPSRPQSSWEAAGEEYYCHCSIGNLPSKSVPPLAMLSLIIP